MALLLELCFIIFGWRGQRLLLAAGFGFALCFAQEPPEKLAVGCPNASVGTNTVSCGGQTYKTVNINGQRWMAENLNYNASGSVCHENDNSNCVQYGRLYDWATAMGISITYYNPSANFKYRGVCPSGWHIPSDAEWTTLTNFAGSSTAGQALKATSGWTDSEGNPSGNGLDSYGFSALPGGFGYSGGSFSSVGNFGGWWSATEDGASYAYGRRMLYGLADVYRNLYDKTYLFTVRCVQD
jgi:uncharacterized protein (TIGR02145 family)